MNHLSSTQFTIFVGRNLALKEAWQASGSSIGTIVAVGTFVFDGILLMLSDVCIEWGSLTFSRK